MSASPLHRARLTAHLLPLALVVLALSCASAGPKPGPGELPLPPAVLAPGDDAAQLAAGRETLAGGRPWHALARALALRKVSNLTPEARAAAEILLEESMAAAAASARRSKEFNAVSSELLPRRSRAIHAIGRARLLLAEGRPMDSFRAIRNLEQEHPTHHLRPEAGDAVAEAGLSLAENRGRYLLFFRQRGRAVTPLEYLVLEHPTHPRCPEAYQTLAAIYEEADRPELAIDRLSDLLLYHPESPRSVEAQARIPTLRLGRIQRNDYDRTQMATAERELSAWMASHGGRADLAPLRTQVEGLLADARERLVQNDLVVARFYLRTDKPFGARLHAERALARANEAGRTDLAEEAAKALAEAGPAAEGPGPSGSAPTRAEGRAP